MLLKRIDSPEQTERRLQDALHAAMGILGWILPDTEESVLLTDQEDGEVEVPDDLNRRIS